MICALKVILIKKAIIALEPTIAISYSVKHCMCIYFYIMIYHVYIYTVILYACIQSEESTNGESNFLVFS